MCINMREFSIRYFLIYGLELCRLLLLTEGYTSTVFPLAYKHIQEPSRCLSKLKEKELVNVCIGVNFIRYSLIFFIQTSMTVFRS